MQFGVRLSLVSGWKCEPKCSCYASLLGKFDIVVKVFIFHGGLAFSGQSPCTARLFFYHGYSVIVLNSGTKVLEVLIWCPINAILYIEWINGVQSGVICRCPQAPTLPAVTPQSRFVTANRPAAVQRLMLTQTRCLNRRQGEIPHQFYWGLAAHCHRTSSNPSLGSTWSWRLQQSASLHTTWHEEEVLSFSSGCVVWTTAFSCHTLLFCPSVFRVSAHLLVFYVQC